MRYIYTAIEYVRNRKAWVIYDVALYGFALYGLYAAVFAY